MIKASQIFQIGFVFLWGLFSVCLKAGDIKVSGSSYIVKRVHVDVTADSALKAKEQAIVQGQEEAFDDLLNYLVSFDEKRYLSGLHSQDFLQDYEIVKQKNSAVRFIADITYRFDKDALKRYLAQEGLTTKEAARRPVLVLPVMEKDGEFVLWGEDNALLKAWRYHPTQTHYANVITPLGDLKDLTRLKVQDVVHLRANEIEKFASLYHAETVLVVLYQPHYVRSYLVQGGQVEKLPLYDVPETDEEQSGYPHLITYILDQMDQTFKGLTQPESATTFSIKVLIEDLSEWKGIQSSLKGIHTLTDMVVESLLPGEIHLNFTFSGTHETLNYQMRKKGLRLEKDASDEWTLRKTT